jgi:tagatose 1,6-diphosphate aldolase
MHSIDELMDDDGRIVGVAVDHRDSFHAALVERGIRHVDEHLVAELKLDIATALMPLASMLLVDEATLMHAHRDGRLDGVAVALPLEAQGYGALHEVEQTRLLDHPSIGEVAEAGAVACKLLLPYRPDHAARAVRQDAVARRAAELCRSVGLPLILEPIVWQAPDEHLSQARLAELVVETTLRLAPLEPGLLKLQYPGSLEACHALHAACGGHPWVLLGGGEPVDELVQHVADACAAGAIGCIVGRSLWAGALDTSVERRRGYLDAISRPALARLAEAIDPARDRPRR